MSLPGSSFPKEGTSSVRFLDSHGYGDPGHSMWGADDLGAGGAAPQQCQATYLFSPGSAGGTTGPNA